MALTLIQLRNSLTAVCRFRPLINSVAVLPVRRSSYESSLFLEDVKITTKYQKTQNADEWKYVEQILPQTLVPNPLKKTEYPSGWKPQAENLKDRPYCICRTKNHMIPVYLDVRQRGVARHTIVRNIQGDIWLFENDLRPFLEDLIKPKPLRLQVNEFAGKLTINGDFVNAIKYWLQQRDF